MSGQSEWEWERARRAFYFPVSATEFVCVRCVRFRCAVRPSASALVRARYAAACARACACSGAVSNCELCRVNFVQCDVCVIGAARARRPAARRDPRTTHTPTPTPDTDTNARRTHTDVTYDRHGHIGHTATAARAVECEDEGLLTCLVSAATTPLVVVVIQPPFRPSLCYSSAVAAAAVPLALAGPLPRRPQPLRMLPEIKREV